MSNFEFEGAFNDISSQQFDFISKVLEDLVCDSKNVKIENFGKADDNYVASVKRITVQKNGKPFKMIVKTAPSKEVIRAAMCTEVQFRNEHLIYTEILPKFTEIEKAAKLPEIQCLKYAACYGSSIEAPNEVIIIEDLNESNFFMLEKSEPLTDDAVRLVLKSFAKLHSLSFALKRQDPKTYAAISRKLTNLHSAMEHIPEMTTFVNNLENDLLGILEDEKYKKVVKGTISHLMANSAKNSAFDMKSKYSVIQHGDSWSNNILFKLNGNKPVECCFIDYQGSRVGSPAADLHYMIFNCTDYETRSKLYHDWINYYHEQLETCLLSLGLKIENVYPRDQLEADFRRIGKMSFGLSALLSTVFMRESSEMEKLKDLCEDNFGESLEQSKVSAASEVAIFKYRQRIEHLLDGFLEYGYL